MTCVFPAPDIPVISNVLAICIHPLKSIERFYYTMEKKSV